MIKYPLGDILKRARAKKGYTQGDLAQMIGKPQGWISDVERFLMPKFDEGIRLCILLDLDPIEVYNEIIEKMK